MSLLGLVLPALVPAISDGLGRLINRIAGGEKPVSVAERVELTRAGNETLVALGSLDQPYGTVSQWVSNLRAGVRPIGALVVLGVSMGFVGYAMYQVQAHPETAATLGLMAAAMLDLVGAVLGYLFGYSAWNHSRDAIMGYFTKKK